MKNVYLNKAISDATMEEMDRDESVILVGLDMMKLNGAFGIFQGCPQKYPDRCIDMPIAELGFSHFAAGAAMAGKRPIVDLMFSDFMTLPSDSIINTAAKYRYCMLGREKMPIVYISGNGSGGLYGGWGMGCNHGNCLEMLFLNVPGLKVVMPLYPEDAKGLMKAAIRDDDPVIFFWHMATLGLRGDVPDEEYIIPLNNAAIVRKEGKDVTLVAVQGIVPFAMEAAAELEKEGIDVEVIDPRVINPLDKEKICKSVSKTGRLVIAHEAPITYGLGGEIASIIAYECFSDLKAPIKRLGQLHTPGPVGPAEHLMQVNKDQIIAAVKEIAK